jgi:integrase
MTALRCGSPVDHRPGKIRSEAGRAKWSSILDQHLVPEFGDLFVDHLQMVDIKAWQGKVARVIKAGDMAPATANTILGVLRQITDEAVDDFDIRDSMRGIDAFDTREHSTYTEEEPNSLSPDQVPSFLSKMLELHSAHYAFTFLGFTTGLRPSSLRPLRREGPTADIKWDDGILVVRRSQTIGDKVMETTKTDLHQRLTLPRELLDVLSWHVNEQLLHTPMRMSELLFPSVHGGFRARSVLDKPFDDVSKAIGLKFNFTPRGMRRTYQDLARAAGIHDAVTRAISGHQTQEMQLLYSTARGGEVKQALSKVAKIATASAKIVDISSARRRRSA